jgi:hypothetical protein
MTLKTRVFHQSWVCKNQNSSLTSPRAGEKLNSSFGVNFHAWPVFFTTFHTPSATPHLSSRIISRIVSIHCLLHPLPSSSYKMFLMRRMNLLVPHFILRGEEDWKTKKNKGINEGLSRGEISESILLSVCQWDASHLHLHQNHYSIERYINLGGESAEFHMLSLFKNTFSLKTSFIFVA